MLKKILRGFLWMLGVLLLLLLIAVIALNRYLDSGREKILSDLANFSGLHIAFRELDINAWRTFPHVSVSLDSLVVRDLARPDNEPALLAVDNLSGGLTLGNLLFDTLRLNHFELKDGAIYIASDSTGKFNLGKLTSPKDSMDDSRFSFLNPKLDWNGMRAGLTNVEVSYLHPTKKKRMEIEFDSLRTQARQQKNGDLTFDTELAGLVHGIAFNTDKGSFLTNTRLSGELMVSGNDSLWTLDTTELRVNDALFVLAAEFWPEREDKLDLFLRNETVEYAATVALLSETIQRNLAKYNFDGPIEASVKLRSTLERNTDPEMEITFDIEGKNVRLLDFIFKDVHTSGVYVNSLATAEGGVPGSNQNFKIKLDSTQGYYSGLFIKAPRAEVRGIPGNTFLKSGLRISGRAKDLNRQLNTQNFIFEKGWFTLNTQVDASLNSMEEIIRTSDGRFSLRNLQVYLRPANVRFPLRNIRLKKEGDDIRFDLKSYPLRTGFTFDMEGRLDNLLPLLLDRPADSIRTEVALRASRIDWVDFLAIFGEEGYFAENGNPPSPGSGTEIQSMKKALLGLQSTFRPHIEARFDTVAYYDVFTINNFSTGLRFNHDTLVLERTTFDWEDSAVGFSTRLDLGQPVETPFQLTLKAEDLDLNRLRPSLEYFGLQLPAGIDSLPEELQIDFAHWGVIKDDFGIKPGTNTGSLAFKEGRADLFYGTLDYAPGPDGLETRLKMKGDPVFVNHLFGAEDFFFGTGSFSINMGIKGIPVDLVELLDRSTLSLQVDDSQIAYRPNNVFIPVRKFSVEAGKGRTTFALDLISEATQQEVSIKGTMDRLAAFLRPEMGFAYQIKADATAASLASSDILGFIKSEVPKVEDTTAFNLQQALAATEGILRTYRPDVSVTIDTFRVNDTTNLLGLHSGFYLKGSTEFVLEESGFKLGEGKVRLSGTYNIDKRKNAPFSVNWSTEAVSLSEVMLVAKQLGLGGPEEPRKMEGILNMKIDMTGQMDSSRRSVLLGNTRATVKLSLEEFALEEWPEVIDFGRKAKMKKRFETLRFGPLTVDLELVDNGVIIPLTEVQSTALQFFVQGQIDSINGPDLLISIPLKNIGRGLLAEPPAMTGFERAGRKVYLVVEKDEAGILKTRFRLGRRKYYKQRNRLEEFKLLKRTEQEERRRWKKSRKGRE
jgi:hypothetical protein